MQVFTPKADKSTQRAAPISYGDMKTRSSDIASKQFIYGSWMLFPHDTFGISLFPFS